MLYDDFSMRKQTIVYLFWLCSFFMLMACTDDDMLIEPDGSSNSVGSCDENIGVFSMLETSLEAVPYAGENKSLVFQNEVGTQEVFTIVERPMREIDGLFFDYNVYEDGDTVIYCYAVERKQYFVSNENLDLEFEINIEVRPYFPALKDKLAADIINIFYTNNQISPGLFTLIFRKNLENRNYPSNLYTNNIVKPDCRFLDAEFKNVERTAFNDPSLTLYFTESEGIVAFENDLFGLWRFVEMR